MTVTTTETPGATEQLAEHDAQMVTAPFGEGMLGFGARVDGRIVLVFPGDQDPAERLRIARHEITRLLAAAEAEHFDWCVPGGCQTSLDDGQPDTTHDGAANELPNRGRHTGRADSLLHSRLYYEDALADGPNLCVTFYDEGTPYSPAEADALIADFETFLTGLKAQRAQLGQGVSGQQVTA